MKYTDINMTLEAFDAELIESGSSGLSNFIDTHILAVLPVVFDDDVTLHDNFRDRIASQFEVSKENVVVVGSARLGFSYTKRTPFSLNSDVDVAIINDRLFDEYSRILCGYHHDVIRRVIALDQSEWSQYLLFLKYFAAGWLRPDKGTPVMNKTPAATDWWKYFRSIS